MYAGHNVTHLSRRFCKQIGLKGQPRPAQVQVARLSWDQLINMKGVKQPYRHQETTVSEIGGFRGEVVTLHHLKSHAPKWTKGFQSLQKAIALNKQIKIQN
jgi:hypothetical protein